jgi:RNA polymerase sigma factor (TIGR02999 family)
VLGRGDTGIFSGGPADGQGLPRTDRNVCPTSPARGDIALSARAESCYQAAVHEITQALQAMHNAEAGAADRLLNLVYNELRRVAADKMALERFGGTLQATALVHETWLRLGGDEQPEWQNRAHFFGAAAEAMRRILIGRARRRNAQRRGSGVLNLNVDDLEVASPLGDETLLAVNEALEKFALVDPPKAELVKLRYFVGLTIEDAASTLSISNATAKRWWAFARAWLNRELAE